MKNKHIVRFLCALFASWFIVSCVTVPETGRRGLMLVSPQEEMQLGLSEFEKMKKATRISRDTAVNEMVQRVGKKIAAVAPLPDAQWEFVVFDEPKSANAFCLPGGKVGVFTGILPITKDENGLATVIGHEVSHAVARHGGERLSQALLTQLGGEALNVALSTKTDTTRQLALQAFGVGTTLGVALPHSRRQELEADHLGLIYMARAGYDPSSAIDFWQRFADYSKQQGKVPEFLSTHPVDKTRIKELKAGLPAAMAEYKKVAR